MNKYIGLSEKEVKENRRIHGVNEIIVKKPNPLLKTIIGIYKEPMFLLLIICVIMYIILGNFSDAIILGIMVIVIIAIEIFQEYKTDKTLEALKELTDNNVTVIRNGKTIIISSKDLVINDLMVINEGDKIGADAIILESNNLYASEASLTGESVPVLKSIDLFNPNDEYKSNYVYASSFITSGNGIAKVVNIGNNTTNGKIAKSLSKIKKNSSPLQKSINSLVKKFGISSLICFLLVIIIITIRINFKEGLLAGLSIAMSVIPEEFPVILTVFLTMGTYKMAKKNTIIRKLPAVETLGCITYLCVDKTGTITNNRMEVSEVYSLNDEKKLIENSILASEELVYDPLESAIYDYAKKFDICKDNVYKNKIQIKKFPFSANTKMVGNVYSIDNKKHLYVKGAVESLFDICNLTVSEKYEIHKKQKELSKKGLRVIGVCSKKVDVIHNDIYKYELDFDGLIGLYDPPKKGIEEDIRICQEAGIKIIMLTGDNKETASAIAKEIGLNNYDKVISGKDLNKLNDKDLKEIIKDIGVFARVTPDSKERIVTVLQSLGEVVGMTGDGVNDATSLKKADIGISMGKRGTEVAKEAGDMILLDDNFSTIVESIKGARTIYNNIKNAVNYVIVMHVPMILLALLIPLFNLPIFLLPIHVVIMELITDPTCSIIFERQGSTDDIMKKPPRNKAERLINVKEVLNCVLKGGIIFTFVFISYIILIEDKILAMSFSFGMLIISCMLLTYSLLYDKNIPLMSILKDKVTILINCIIILFVIAMIYTPFLNSVVHTKPLSMYMLLLMIILSFISVFGINFLKKRRTN